MNTRLLLGTHVSVAGGIHTAVERGERIGCTTMQVFVKNSNQWEGKPLTPDDVTNYKTAAAKSTILPVFAHAAYLINLCAKNPDIRARSRRAYRDELTRCADLGLRGLIVHPGAHLGEGEESGIREIAASLNAVHDQTSACSALSILESTAGQGTSLGYRFEHLRDILGLVRDRHRVAVCLDTAHLFAAGYDIGTEEGWEQTIDAFDRIVGLQSLAVLHVNDSKKPLGSRVDRHEHIGKGLIGITGFRMLMNDLRLAGVPKILETEKSEDMHEDVENMALLRSLIASGPAA